MDRSNTSDPRHSHTSIQAADAGAVQAMWLHRVSNEDRRR